jgi:hypothetical protein
LQTHAAVELSPCTLEDRVSMETNFFLPRYVGEPELKRSAGRMNSNARPREDGAKTATGSRIALRPGRRQRVLRHRIAYAE